MENTLMLGKLLIPKAVLWQMQKCGREITAIEKTLINNEMNSKQRKQRIESFYLNRTREDVRMKRYRPDEVTLSEILASIAVSSTWVHS